MNRLQRLSAILIQLQSGGWVKSQKIAERFDISIRTVYRDIQSLEATGVPIIGEAGHGYRLVDGYRLPPVQFSYQEAAAMFTAEKLMERHTDKGLDQHFKSALFKIKSILRQTDKDFVNALEDNIQVMANPYLPETDQSASYIQSLIEAIASKTKMHLQYQSRETDKITARDIDPVGIFHSMSKWHLIAWCHVRQDYRDFRLDRIKSLNKTEDKFTQTHPTLKKYLSKFTQKEKLIRIELKINKEHSQYLGDQKYYSGYISEKIIGDKVIMTFLTASMNGFAHWYMMIGEYAEIVQPQELKDEVRKMLDLLLTKI